MVITCFCAVYGWGVETENHLFVLCPLAWSTWIEVYRWFGVVKVLLGSIWSIFKGFLSLISRGKKLLNEILMVWHAVIWILWRVRNNKIFSGKSILVDNVLEKIKCTSWKWLLATETNLHCSFYKWRVNPLDCIAIAR
jgi:hypothetical protein